MKNQRRQQRDEEDLAAKLRLNSGRDNHRHRHHTRPCRRKAKTARFDHFHAARTGDLERLQEILEARSWLAKDASKQYGWTVLHFACENGHLEVVQYLVEKYGVIEPPTQNCAPLHIAANNGHLEVVRYLVEGRHVDVNARRWDNDTPLHLACGNCSMNITWYLLFEQTEQRVNLTQRNQQGRTALERLSREFAASGTTARRWLFQKEDGSDHGEEDENDNQRDEDSGSCSPAELLDMLNRFYLAPYIHASSMDWVALPPAPWEPQLRTELPDGLETQETLLSQIASYMAPSREEYVEVKRFAENLQRRLGTYGRAITTPPTEFRQGVRIQNNAAAARPDPPAQQHQQQHQQQPPVRLLRGLTY